MTTLDTLRLYNANIAQTRATIAKDPAVKRQIDYFSKTVGTIKTSKDFVNNYQVLSFALEAYGLSDLTYAKAYIQKIIDGGVSSTSSLANRLNDPRFKAFAAAFDFGDKGAAATSGASVVSTTTSKFVEQTLEDQAGAIDQGAQLALYFQRVAPNITSGYQILADKALTQFVQTIFKIPPVTSTDTLDAAAKNIESKINLSDLKDPAKVQKLVTRFASAWDAANSNAGDTNAAVQLISGSAGGTSGFSQDLLLQIQRAYTRF